MQTYNQFTQGNIMPLLMNFTTPTPIQDADDIPFTYNDGQQISYDMRMIGTKSFKMGRTKIAPHKDKQDNRNEIDDTKNVK